MMTLREILEWKSNICKANPGDISIEKMAEITEMFLDKVDELSKEGFSLEDESFGFVFEFVFSLFEVSAMANIYSYITLFKNFPVKAYSPSSYEFEINFMDEDCKYILNISDPREAVITFYVKDKPIESTRYNELSLYSDIPVKTREVFTNSIIDMLMKYIANTTMHLRMI